MRAVPPLGSRTFAALPEQVAIARGWLSELLGHGHPAHDNALLLLSETFTNGVRHSKGGEIAVSAFIEDACVRVEVIDGGGETVPQDGEASDENGRGLAIIRALAGRWGFEEERDRLRVWFTIPAPEGARTGAPSG